jgi:hypothetical protein
MGRLGARRLAGACGARARACAVVSGEEARPVPASPRSRKARRFVHAPGLPNQDGAREVAGG